MTLDSGAAGARVSGGRPFRLAFLLHLDSDLAPDAAYREAIALFVAAEQLGYDSGWVIHRHFRQGNEHVSAPLVHVRLLTATAQDVAPVLGWRPPPRARAGATEAAASSSHPDRWPIRA